MAIKYIKNINMNNDNILEILLHSNIKTVINIFHINKYFSELSANYTWKLLCDRDFENYNTNEKKFMYEYMVCYHSTILKNELYLDESVHKIRDLEYICKNGSSLSKIPKSIFVLDRIGMLVINNTEIKTIPEEIMYLNTLQCLDVRDNFIIELPSQIKYININSIYLSNNCLKTFPIELCSLKNMKIIDLSRNYIKSIPREIKNLRNLHDLVLSKNFIEYIPDELCELKKLRRLILSKNMIKLIPDNICRMTSLNQLQLANNLIEYIPCEMATMETLENLNLRKNKLLEYIPREFGNCTNPFYINNTDIPVSKLRRYSYADGLGGICTFGHIYIII